MLSHTVARSRWLSFILVALLLAAQTAQGGFCRFGFRNQGVGGVSIDAHGVVTMPTVVERGMLAKGVREITGKAPDAMTAPVGLRKISLRRLEAAIQEARRKGHTALPDEIAFLVGMQRIEYIFVYPEEHDIVIAGPGEGWTVNETGDVVGITTGRPVMRLDDLLIALRTAGAARHESISVSIDPTTEGLQAYNNYIGGIRQFSEAAVAEAARRMGPQQVTIKGVPADSHFARVMVAADIHMKRYQMGFDATPVKGLPSYLHMLKSSGGRVGSAMPRWWLECNYEPLGRSEDGLSWHLRGPGVKAMVEDEVRSGGKLSGTGRANPLAKKWSATMTEHYDEFAAAQPVFGELRNLMDMAVLAALIQKEDLLGEAGLELPALMGAEGGVEVTSWNAPKSVDSRYTFIQAGREWIISVSGGVEINSWQIASQNEVEPRTAELRKAAVMQDKTAWWSN